MGCLLDTREVKVGFVAYSVSDIPGSAVSSCLKSKGADCHDSVKHKTRDIIGELGGLEKLTILKSFFDFPSFVIFFRIRSQSILTFSGKWILLSSGGSDESRSPGGSISRLRTCSRDIL